MNATLEWRQTAYGPVPECEECRRFIATEAFANAVADAAITFGTEPIRLAIDAIEQYHQNTHYEPPTAGPTENQPTPKN